MRKIIHSSNIQLAISEKINLTPEMEQKVMKLAVTLIATINFPDAPQKLKAKDLERTYIREADATVYWLIDRVPYGAPMDKNRNFNSSEGKPVMEMDLTDDELQDLIVELSGYFNDIKI